MNQVNSTAKSRRMITDRQKEVYDNIIRYQLENGFSPTVRELCTMIGVTSTSTIAGHLKSLEKYGYIRKKSCCPRAIDVL